MSLGAHADALSPTLRALAPRDVSRGLSQGVINSSHCPFAAMAEYKCCDRNAGYCAGFTAAPEPNLHRPEELYLKTRLRYGETGAGQVSLSPRVSFACAILGSVTVKLLHGPEACLVPQPAPAITIPPDFLSTFKN